MAFGILSREDLAALKSIDLASWLEQVDRRSLFGELQNIRNRDLPNYLSPSAVDGRLYVGSRRMAANEIAARIPDLQARAAEIEQLLSRPALYSDAERAARLREALAWSEDFRSHVPISDETGAARIVARDALESVARDERRWADVVSACKS